MRKGEKRSRGREDMGCREKKGKKGSGKRRKGKTRAENRQEQGI